MSKGTKQVRSGKLVEMVRNMEQRVERLLVEIEEHPKSSEENYYVAGQIEELELCIHMIKTTYSEVFANV